MADSVVVEAESIRAAVEEGARRLQATPSEVRYGVIAEGRRGFLGLGARPWRVRVERRDVLTPRIEEALRAAADIDGSFETTYEGRNVFLTIRPPVGAGRPVDADEVARALREMEVEGWGIEEVRTLIRAATGRPAPIGRFRTAGTIDSYLKVHIEADRMRAYATIVPPRRGGREMEMDGLLKGLERAGVVHGIRRTELEYALARRLQNEPILAAEGTPPHDGADGRIEFFFRTDRHRGRPAEDEHGRVDFRELGLVENVVEGQPLARIVPATPGEDGTDVTGGRIPARPGRAAHLPAGVNVVRDGDVLRAGVSGHVTYVRGRVRVDPLFTVPGDVDISVGNIRFQGTVEIGGMIEDGFRVEATGSILVRRSIGKAQVKAGGNVVVLGGIAGKDEALIQAEGDVVAKYVERAKVVAGRDVEAAEAILHAQVLAGHEVVVEGGRGAVIGGLVSAGRRITVRAVGGEGAARTVLRVGIDAEVLQRIETLQEMIAREEKRLGPIEEALRLIGGSRTVAPDVAARKGNLEEARERIRGVIASHRERLRALETSLELLDPPPLVRVADRAYAGTRIEIGRVSMVLQEPARFVHCAFRRVGGEIQVGPY